MLSGLSFSAVSELEASGNVEGEPIAFKRILLFRENKISSAKGDNARGNLRHRKLMGLHGFTVT